MDAAGLQMIISIVIGAFATFCAIMLWPRTRDLAWMLIIIGTIVHYGAVIFQALEVFGVARIQVADETAGTLIRSALMNLPFVLYALGFIIMIRRKSGG
jgi:hypothetical protein